MKISKWVIALLLIVLAIPNKQKEGGYSPEHITGTTGETLPRHQIERFDESDIEQMAQIVWLEARGEEYMGQRYVAAVILNRVESNIFPNTVLEVISDKGQFATYRARNRAKPDEVTYKAIKDEIENRSNEEILYFRSGHYHKGHPQAFKYGNHYFSK